MASLAINMTTFWPLRRHWLILWVTSLLGHIVRGCMMAHFPDLEDQPGHRLGSSPRPPAATVDLSRASVD